MTFSCKLVGISCPFVINLYNLKNRLGLKRSIIVNTLKHFYELSSIFILFCHGFVLPAENNSGKFLNNPNPHSFHSKELIALLLKHKNICIHFHEKITNYEFIRERG